MQKNSRGALISILLAVCAAARAGAGVNAWTGAGPYGAIQLVLAFDPSNADRVYCGVQGDVFASTDGGATWARVGAGLRTDGVFTYTGVAVDPNDSTHLLASAADEETESGDGGIYESTDRGATWRPAAGSGNTAFAAVAFSPVSPSQGFAATLFAGGVMASTDGGATWTDPSGGSFPPSGERTSGPSLTVLPSNPPSLLIGGSSGEVWKSTDAGGTWNKRTAGVPGQYVESISASPVDPTLIWASGSGGVFKSHNSGDTWTTTAFPPVDLDWFFPTVTADPASTNDAWEQEAALVYRTTDGGKTWIPKTNSAEILPNSGVFINANRPGTVWLSTNAGPYRTTDSGATWADSSTGLIGSAIATVALSPSVAGPIYAGSYSGVAVSSDGGLTWSPSRNGVDAGFYFLSIAVDPQNPATAYSTGIDALSTRSVLLTRNGGNTWTSVSTPFSYAHQISVCPVSSAVVLTATGTGLWRTTNSGASWTNVRAGDSFSAVAFGFANVSLAYAIGGQTGFQRSTDGGVTWKPGGGLPGAGTPAAFASDPTNSSLVYLATDVNFLKSTDAGSSWRTLPGPAGANAIGVDPAHPNRLWAGTADGIAFSADSGESWTANPFAFADGGANQFAFDTKRATILVATNAHGVLGLTLEDDLVARPSQPVPTIVRGR